MRELFDLGGRVAAVTGANTGLGQAMAVALAGAGAKVALVCRSEPEETRRLIAGQGGESVVIRAELSTIAHCERIVEETIAAFGSLDILVNNAGIIRRQDMLNYTEEDWDAVMTVNLKSLFLLSQAVARHMVATGRQGRIINIASLLSFQGGIRVPAYTAAKHGVAGLTKLMANELAPRGITVNAIAPGYMETDNTAALRADPERTRQLMERIPAGRWGAPQDLATAVLFFAAPASGYVTGTVLPVDGGWMAR